MIRKYATYRVQQCTGHPSHPAHPMFRTCPCLREHQRCYRRHTMELPYHSVIVVAVVDDLTLPHCHNLGGAHEKAQQGSTRSHWLEKSETGRSLLVGKKRNRPQSGYHTTMPASSATCMSYKVPVHHIICSIYVQPAIKTTYF